MELNAANQTKWNSLQDEGQTQLNKILDGGATDADLKSLSSLLTQQHALAGELFDKGVEDAKVTADTIVDRLNKERIDSGKKALTGKAHQRVFDSTFKKVMSQAIEDILGQIHDEFQEQEEESKKRVDAAIEKMQMGRRENTAPTPSAASTEDAEQKPRSLMDKFQGANGTAPSSYRRPSLMDRAVSRTRGGTTAVLGAIKESVTNARDKISGLYDRFTRRDDEDEDKKATIWLRKLRSMFNPVRNAYGKTKQGASKLRDLMSLIGKPLLLAVMNPQLIKSITDAVSEYLSFDKISAFIGSTWDEVKKLGSDSIDWIIQKVKDFFTGGKKKGVPAANGKKADPLTQNTQAGALPASITAAQAAKDLPTYQGRLTSAQSALQAAETKYAQQPTAANKKAVDDARRNVAFFQTRVNQYSVRAGQQSSTAGSSIDKAAGLAAPATTVVDPTSTEVSPQQLQQKAGGTDGPQIATTSSQPQAADPSEIIRKSSAGAVQKTESVPDMPVMQPGKAFDPVELRELDEPDEVRRGAAIAQIGMASFGYDSPDSALNILNLGMIS